MIEGELLYFTPAEFVVMMELAGEGPYSMMFTDETEIDDVALTQAFTTLFQRDLIFQQGVKFMHSSRGQLFKSLRQAQFAVMISAENAHRYTAGCYVANEVLWLVECIDTALSKQLRLQKLRYGDIEQWLLDKEIFEKPVLDEENARYLADEFREVLANPAGSQMLKLERYHNGGASICTYELLAMDGCNVVVRRGIDGCIAKIYTVEAMSRMLSECFGRNII